MIKWTRKPMILAGLALLAAASLLLLFARGGRYPRLAQPAGTVTMRLASERRRHFAIQPTGDHAMPTMSRSVLAALMIALGLTSCSLTQQPTPVPDQAGLPNPASVFCEGQGGRLEIRTDSTGAQTGFCIFSDGSECEEWAFFRSECRQGYVATREAAPTSAPVVDPGASAPEGWEVYTDTTLGYSFFYPTGSALEMDAQGRYLSVIGPVENNEHWPWFSIAHPDEPDYHPPADAVLQTWLAEHYRLPGQVMGTRTIAGEAAVHTRIDNGPQAYDDDRFYFVHAGQVYEIVVMHSGKEDWSVYDIFLDSFRF